MGLRRTALDYWRLLTGYLPPGAAWRVWRTLTSSTYGDGMPRPASPWGRLLMGLADELARADIEWLEIAESACPGTGTRLLNAWEETLFGSSQAWTLKPIDRRVRELVAHLRNSGGLSPEYWRDVLSAYGFPDAEVYSGPWRLWWTVKCPSGITRFRAMSGLAGDRLVKMTPEFVAAAYTLWYWRPAGTSIWWTD